MSSFVFVSFPKILIHLFIFPFCLSPTLLFSCGKCASKPSPSWARLTDRPKYLNAGWTLHCSMQANICSQSLPYRHIHTVNIPKILHKNKAAFTLKLLLWNWVHLIEEFSLFRWFEFFFNLSSDQKFQHTNTSLLDHTCVHVRHKYCTCYEQWMWIMIYIAILKKEHF